jgi:hypothetical protein
MTRRMMLPLSSSLPLQSPNGSTPTTEQQQQGTTKHQSQQKKTMMMATSKYKFLCGRIIVTLLTEIGILLSIFVTYSCTFYEALFVNANDAHDMELVDPITSSSIGTSTTHDTIVDSSFPIKGKMILNIGLFKYSLTQEPLTLYGHSQCTLYGTPTTTKLVDNTTNNNNNSLWADETWSMAQGSQRWAITAPVLAVVGLIVMGGFEVNRARIRWDGGRRPSRGSIRIGRCRRRRRSHTAGNNDNDDNDNEDPSSTGARDALVATFLTCLFLILAAICQIVAILTFDSEQAWYDETNGS